MAEQHNYINKENSNDANIQTSSSFVGRKIEATQNVVVKNTKNKKFPIPLMQKTIKQRIGEGNGDRYEVREDMDFDCPETYAPNFTSESVTDKSKQKQIRNNTSKNVPTQSTKSKSSQKNSSRQPNTTKSSTNGNIDIFFKHTSEYPQSKQIQSNGNSSNQNAQQQIKVRITQKNQEKQQIDNLHQNPQQGQKRTVSKHTAGNKSSVALTAAGVQKKKSKKKTISLKGFNNTQTTSSDLNTISQIPSDSINIFNLGVPISSHQQTQHNNNNINNMNGNYPSTSQRINNHINTAQQQNLLSQNQQSRLQDNTVFYQNQQQQQQQKNNNNYESNSHNMHHQQLHHQQLHHHHNHHENGQILHTSNTATFEAHDTIDVEEYKVKSSKKSNLYANHQINDDKRQRTSTSNKKKDNISKRQSSRSKSLGKKSQHSKVNGSISQGNTTFTKSKQVDLNKTDTLDNTNKSFTQNNKKKTQRSPSGGGISGLNQISIDHLKKKKLQEIIHKQQEIEKEKEQQQKKLQLQIDNETIRINNGQRFLKQKAKKDNSSFPWGFDQKKRQSQMQKQQERSYEKINNTNTTAKFDDNIRRQRLGLTFLNYLDEHTMQSIKKKNMEQKEQMLEVQNKLNSQKHKTFEEHQHLQAFIEYKKQIQEENEKQEQEIKEFQRHKIEHNLKALNETIKRQQRTSRSKSVTKKKSFIMNGGEQNSNSYYNVQNKNRSTSNDAYAISRVPSELLRNQAFQNQLFFQNNQFINQPCGDINIDFEALENEQNSDRKFSVLNTQCKSIISQALEDQKIKQQNLDSSILSNGNKGGHLNQTQQQNYYQNGGSHPGKMSSGKTSLHSFITKNSKEMSNQKMNKDSNRNLSFEQKKQKIYEQFLNLGQRFQSLHIANSNPHQSQLINQNIPTNMQVVQNQSHIQQQQLQQILQSREQYEEYIKSLNGQVPSAIVQQNNSQQMYAPENYDDYDQYQQRQEQVAPDLPSENDIVDERLVIEEFKSSSSSEENYSDKKISKTQQNGQQMPNTSKQSFSNRYSNQGQDSEVIYNENMQSTNHQQIQEHDEQEYDDDEEEEENEDDQDEDYRKLDYNQQGDGVHIISPLEFNGGMDDGGSSLNVSPGNQKWVMQRNNANNPHVHLHNQMIQEKENTQRSKPISSISNQKNQRSDFMYNQSSQSFNDMKESSRQINGVQENDSSRSHNQNERDHQGYNDYEDEYENDEEELKNLKEIRDIEQQALLNSTNANLNKTNNLSIISNQPLIMNNNAEKNKKRKIVKHPVLQYILDLMDGFVQQEVKDDQLTMAIEQMQQAAMLIQKVWKGYYTRIILGYRLEMILQEENNASFDLTDEQNEELLKMQILQYKIDNNEDWTEEQLQEYYQMFKQKNDIEKEKRRALRKQLQSGEDHDQKYQEQYYQNEQSYSEHQNSQLKNQQNKDQKMNHLNDPSTEENRHIAHSTSSYDLQNIDSRKKDERNQDQFEDEDEDEEEEDQEEEENDNYDNLQKLSDRRGVHQYNGKNQHISSQIDQKGSVSNKQTDEVLNTEDLLMDDEQYIKSAQRYQHMKENQPFLLDHQIDINYDELMRPDIHPKKFSPHENIPHRQPQQQQLLQQPTIQYHPIDPRYQAQQKLLQQQANAIQAQDFDEEDYENEEKGDNDEEIDPQYQGYDDEEEEEGQQDYDGEEEEGDDNDQHLLNLLKQGINLNQFGGKETYDAANNKLLIQDGDGVYELDLSKLPGINNLHFKEDQYVHSMRDQKQSGQKYSDFENSDSYSQRQKLTTKEVGIGEKEYVNFDAYEDGEGEYAEINNYTAKINNEKDFNKVQNVSKKRKMNLGIVIDDDDDNNCNDQMKINFIDNNIANQGASKQKDQIPSQIISSHNQKHSVGSSSIPFEKLPEIPPQNVAAKNQGGEQTQLDRTGEKIKQYNNYMENLEFSEKKAAAAAQSAFKNEEEDDEEEDEENEFDENDKEIEQEKVEGEEEYEEYEIDFEQLLMKEKYQDEEGNIFIIDNGDRIYLGEEEIEALQEYEAHYMQKKRVKEDNSFEKDNDSYEEDEANFNKNNPQNQDEENNDDDYEIPVDDDEDDEDIYDDHIQNHINELSKQHQNHQFRGDQYDNGSSEEAIHGEILADQFEEISKQEQLNLNRVRVPNNINESIPQLQQEHVHRQINNIQTTKIQDNNINVPSTQNNLANNNIQSEQQNNLKSQLNPNKSISNDNEQSDSSKQLQLQNNVSLDNIQKNTQQYHQTQNSNLSLNQQVHSSPTKSQNSINNNINNNNNNNNNNEFQMSDFKNADISQLSYKDSRQTQDLSKTKQEQVKQWADIVSMLEEYDQSNPLSIIEQIKLKSQLNIKQLTTELKTEEEKGQNILDFSPTQGFDKSQNTNQEDNSKSHRSAKKKLVIDVEKIEGEFLQKVSQQNFYAQENQQLKKEQNNVKHFEQSQNNEDQIIENDSQSFDDITSASKMKRKFFQQRVSNIDQLIPSFHFSAKTQSTPGKQNFDTEENEDGSSATGSLFEAVPFQDFYQKKYRELMKKDDINKILMIREEALTKRHNLEERDLKKKLEKNRISPRTYDIKRLELEKMVTKEREQIIQTRSDIERTWNQTAQTIARTQRDLMFLQKMKASQELNPSHTHNPHQMLMLNMNSPPPLFTEGAESLSCRNPTSHLMYSSTSSSAFKQRRVLFKSESENETEGTWKHYHKNFRYALNDLKSPESSNNQNIIVIDSYEPRDISKRNNTISQKSINFSKTLGSTLPNEDNKSQQNNSEHTLSHEEISSRQKSVSSNSHRLKTDHSHSQHKLNSDHSEREHSIKMQKQQEKRSEDEEYDDDFEINDDESQDSKILEKQLQELNINGDNESQGQEDIDKEREEFEESYKNLDTTVKKNDDNDEVQNQAQIPYNFSLSQQKEQDEFDEKNIYSSSRKLYDAALQSKDYDEEYFQELLQQTPATNNHHSYKNNTTTNSKDDSNRQSSSAQISQSNQNQFAAAHDQGDFTDRSKDQSISSSQKEAIAINKKLFAKEDNAAGYNITEDEMDNLSENKSLEISSSIFQKTPAQITKNRPGQNAIGQKNLREPNESGDFSIENMISSASASGNIQGIMQQKNSTALSSIDWDNQLSSRQSAEESEFKSSAGPMNRNQLQKYSGGFEKKSNTAAASIFMAEELDSNIEQYHMQNTNYQNSVQNLCANYHNNYSLTESLNTCHGQVSINSAIASQIQQSNQIHSSYKQIFPKSSNKSSAEKFSDFNYSTSKEMTMNLGEDEDTAQKVIRKDNIQSINQYQITSQQGSIQAGYIYDIQDDYEIDLEYEASANKQKLIDSHIKSDLNIKSRNLASNSTITLQTPNEDQELAHGKDVNIQNISAKYDSEVFVEESLEEQEKDILQLSNLMNHNLISNMQPLVTVEDSLSEESELAEFVNINMKQGSAIPNRELRDEEIPSSSFTPKDDLDDVEEDQEYENEHEEENIYSMTTEQKLRELQQKTIKNQNVDYLCDDLINNLMDEVTDGMINSYYLLIIHLNLIYFKQKQVRIQLFHRNSRIVQNILKIFKENQINFYEQKVEQKLITKEVSSYEHQEYDEEENIIQQELEIAQKEYNSGPSQSLKQRMLGIQTQMSAVKNYLTKLSDYITQNYLNTFVERINYSLGPTAIEMLKFLHFSDQNYSLDSQLDNSQDFSMQHSAVLVTDLYSTFEMLLLEEKKLSAQLLVKESNSLQNTDDQQCDDTDDDDIIVTGQLKVSLKDITHIHNKVIFDAFNEALDSHRLYGLKGRPFPWKVDATKINNSPITHDRVPAILSRSIQKVLEWAECQCGFIFDRPDTQLPLNQNLTEEYISQVKEKRLTVMLHQEVKEAEEKWIIYDDEYTEIQVEISELVFQELLLELDLELNKINNPFEEQNLQINESETNQLQQINEQQQQL